MLAPHIAAPKRNAAFEQQVVTYWPNLLKFAHALTRDFGRSEDLVQETFALALSRAHQFEEGTNLRAWLFTILVNLVRNDARRARVRSVVVDIEKSLNTVITPARQESALTMRDVGRALAKLSKEHQEVLEIVAFYGYKYDEAAVILGIPVGTVRSRLSRARKHAARLINGSSPE